ncbi:MAG TPA: hypothetical protein DCL61_16075 [Cyanobacteria bacterium UBA12227]|nr:hypothetical protein [Cyanobacteria bacterium UBA12227]HAX86396.1 hypothetical protein [Cyanobacteria bacterium UBA11370]HBY79488.1 hypothetical protein [Cyanobacteria bacterium UBA11148]
MNSDINNSSDTFYSRLIAWLLQESVPAAVPSADGQAQSHVPLGETIAADFELDQLDPLDLEDVNIAPTITNEAAQYRARVGSEDNPTRETIEQGGSTRPYNLGEMPTVQNRFQALIKRKLQLEIERHPPLFPWETEIRDYEPDFPDTVADRWVPPVRLWLPQLANLALPVSLPETILASLLNACSEAVYSRYQLGRKMVQAVENLFPGQFQLLNDQAQMVLLSSGSGRDPEPVQSLLRQLPSSPYEDATNEQKMILALLAAKEIISTLTVPISPKDSPVERQWETTVGLVMVQAEYQMQQGVPKIRVTARLPRGGSLTLRTPQASAESQRTYPGYVSVESFDLQPNQTYPLEIRFHDVEQTPLVFAIYPTM